MKKRILLLLLLLFSLLAWGCHHEQTQDPVVQSKSPGHYQVERIRLPGEVQKYLNTFGDHPLFYQVLLQPEMQDWTFTLWSCNQGQWGGREILHVHIPTKNMTIPMEIALHSTGNNLELKAADANYSEPNVYDPHYFAQGLKFPIAISSKRNCLPDEEIVIWSAVGGYSGKEVPPPLEARFNKPDYPYAKVVTMRTPKTKA